jgi:hypothetical protein
MHLPRWVWAFGGLSVLAAGFVALTPRAWSRPAAPGPAITVTAWAGAPAPAYVLTLSLLAQGSTAQGALSRLQQEEVAAERALQGAHVPLAAVQVMGPPTLDASGGSVQAGVSLSAAVSSVQEAARVADQAGLSTLPGSNGYYVAPAPSSSALPSPQDLSRALGQAQRWAQATAAAAGLSLGPPSRVSVVPPSGTSAVGSGQVAVTVTYATFRP